MKFLKNGNKLTVVVDVDGSVCTSHNINWDEVDNDLEKFMKNKYDLESLQKLLQGIIFQLASKCPLDWEK